MAETTDLEARLKLVADGMSVKAVTEIKDELLKTASAEELAAAKSKAMAESEKEYADSLLRTVAAMKQKERLQRDLDRFGYGPKKKEDPTASERADEYVRRKREDEAVRAELIRRGEIADPDKKPTLADRADEYTRRRRADEELRAELIRRGEIADPNRKQTIDERVRDWVEQRDHAKALDDELIRLGLKKDPKNIGTLERIGKATGMDPAHLRAMLMGGAVRAGLGMGARMGDIAADPTIFTQGQRFHAGMDALSGGVYGSAYKTTNWLSGEASTQSKLGWAYRQQLARHAGWRDQEQLRASMGEDIAGQDIRAKVFGGFRFSSRPHMNDLSTVAGRQRYEEESAALPHRKEYEVAVKEHAIAMQKSARLEQKLMEAKRIEENSLREMAENRQKVLNQNLSGNALAGAGMTGGQLDARHEKTVAAREEYQRRLQASQEEAEAARQRMVRASAGAALAEAEVRYGRAEGQAQSVGTLSASDYAVNKQYAEIVARNPAGIEHLPPEVVAGARTLIPEIVAKAERDQGERRREELRGMYPDEHKDALDKSREALQQAREGAMGAEEADLSKHADTMSRIIERAMGRMMKAVDMKVQAVEEKMFNDANIRNSGVN